MSGAKAFRSHEELPSPKEAAGWLREGASLHLVGRRAEAQLALYTGPVFGVLISVGLLGALLGMMPPSAPRWFLLGPGIALFLGIGWALYARRTLANPRAETGIHLDNSGVMTFGLRRRAPYFVLPWGACESFRSRDAGLWVRVSPPPRPAGTLLDREWLVDGEAPLNLPSGWDDPMRLADWLELLRRAVVAAQNSPR
jgi:hypothetical protein